MILLCSLFCMVPWDTLFRGLCVYPSSGYLGRHLGLYGMSLRAMTYAFHVIFPTILLISSYLRPCPFHLFTLEPCSLLLPTKTKCLASVWLGHDGEGCLLTGPCWLMHIIPELVCKVCSACFSLVEAPFLRWRAVYIAECTVAKGSVERVSLNIRWKKIV